MAENKKEQQKNVVWTIGKILQWTEQYFQKAGLESPRLDAEVLLSHVLHKERIFLYVHFDQPLEQAELAAYRECIKARAAHRPVAYITGHKEFMGLDFQVTKDTLIPRPDTEILVEAVLKRLKPGGGEAPIADIGTGTGAICLSLLKYLPQLRAVATDISTGALAVAQKNAASLEVADRVEFRQGDMLAPLRQWAGEQSRTSAGDATQSQPGVGEAAQGRSGAREISQRAGRLFAAILSNPPYIPKGDIAGLEPDVRAFEPMSALDGGLDGLDYYRQLLAGAAELLEPEGFLAVEVGIGQAGQLRDMAANMPQWGKCEILRDLAGIERVVILWKA